MDSHSACVLETNLIGLLQFDPDVRNDVQDKYALVKMDSVCKWSNHNLRIFCFPDPDFIRMKVIFR